MAAVLASGEGAVISHWAAAALWMVRPNSRSAVDVTVPHRSRSSKLIRRHVSIAPDDERTIEEGIPVTTVPRTTLDLAATESVEVVKNLLKEAEYRQLWDRLSLWDLVERYDRLLRVAGYSVTRITWNQLDDEPRGGRR